MVALTAEETKHLSVWMWRETPDNCHASSVMDYTLIVRIVTTAARWSHLQVIMTDQSSDRYSAKYG